MAKSAEIEITPEMVEAATLELCGFDPEWDSAGQVARNMLEACFSKSDKSTFSIRPDQ